MKVKKSFRSRKGFTLIELLVSIGVFGIIAGIAITIFVTLSASYDKAAVVASVNHEGNRLMELITRVVRNSVDASVYNAGKSLGLTIPAESSNLEFSTNGGCRTVDLTWDDTAGALTLNKTNQNCDGTSLCPVGTPCVMNSDEVIVKDMLFEITENVGSPDVIKITMTLQQDPSLADPDQQSSQQFQKVVLTRGY